MRFVLLSRHSHGSDVPPEKTAEHLKELGEWMALLRPSVAIPTRGGKSVTAGGVTEYAGDLGGLLIYEANSLEEAIALARKSPGLKYGFTHEVLPEIALEVAAGKRVGK